MGRKREHDKMICARCGEATPDDPCVHCGESPILDERYVLQRVLGTGSEGTTYRAQRIEGRKIVAVKEMPLRRARDDKARELRRREASTLRQLDHCAIPRYLDDFTAGSGKNRSYYLVQEFIDGRSLAAEEEDHRYDLGEVLAILEELAEVLVYLHGLSPPVIHRDIKPSNVMRRRGGELVLIDFGSVRDVLVDLEMGGATVTGTFGYMAPEQMMGDASEASDLYGLGALAIKLLSRREPHTLLRHDRTLDWEPYVSVPRGVKKLLRSLLQPDPARRASDAAQVCEQLGRLRETTRGDSDPTRGDGPVTDLRALVGKVREGPERMIGRATIREWSIAAVIVLAIGVAAFVKETRNGAQDEPEEEPAPAVRVPPPEAVVSTEITVGSEGLIVETRVETGLGTYPPRSGETDAPVTIVVFSDFACGYCEGIAATLARVDLEYADQVAVYFRDYPLDIHPDAYDAHEAARCAHEQGLFWVMHDKLFENQRALKRDGLRDYAVEAGVEPHAFDQCMRTGATRLDIELDRRAGREIGITGTPTFLVNGAKYTGGLGFPVVKGIVDGELSRSTNPKIL